MMQFKEIMPHVRFETKDYGRNEQASRDAGRHIPNVGTFIVITSHGSKDASEHLVGEWLKRKREEASRGAYNLEWVEYFEKQYKAWQDGHELPRIGTPMHTWQMVSVEQRSRLIALDIKTVEDLSAIPDSSLGTYGLDARVLRDMARNWIAEGQQKGVNAQELANAQAEIRRLKEVNERQESRLAALESRLQDEKPARRKAEAA